MDRHAHGVATVLIPFPAGDFDPTEVAVSWQVLTGDGHAGVLSTESGITKQLDGSELRDRSRVDR